MVKLFLTLLVVALPDVDQMPPGSASPETQPPSALVQFAEEFLATQSKRIDRQMQQMVHRMKIDPERLPEPEIRPRATVDLVVGKRQAGVGQQVAADLRWTITTNKRENGQFVFHTHVAHFRDQKYIGGVSSAGVASDFMNGRRYKLRTDMRATHAGAHRVIAVVSAHAFKTNEVFVLAVAELNYHVTTSR